MTTQAKLWLAAFLCLVTSTFGFLQPFLPIYLEAAGCTRQQIGWIFGLGAAIALLVQPVWGRWMDRLDRRRPFIILFASLSAAAYLCMRYAQTPGQFLVVCAIGTNGALFLNSAGATMVGRLVSKSAGGASYANLRVWGSVGYIVVTLITGLVLTPAGQKLNRAALEQVFTYGPLLFVLIAITGFFLPDPSRPEIQAGSATEQASDAKTNQPTLSIFLISYFLYVFALYGASNFLSLYMREVGGQPIWITGMFAGGVICEVFVMRMSGRLSDRFGRRPVLAVTYLLLPIRLALYAFAVNPLQVFLVQVLHGINFGIMGAISVALINDTASNQNRGEAQAKLSVTNGISGASAPIIFGWIADAAGLPAMFFCAAGIALVGTLVFLLKVEETNSAAQALPMAPSWLKSPILGRRNPS